jgi:hypothetical protein
MAKKKRRTVLPRVTVFAMNRSDLIDFVQSVQRLGVMVDDLHAALNRMNAKKKKPALPSVTPAPEVQK